MGVLTEILDDDQIAIAERTRTCQPCAEYKFGSEDCSKKEAMIECSMRNWAMVTRFKES